MNLRQAILYRLERLRIQRVARRRRGERRKDLGGTGCGTETGRARLREQHRHELGAVPRELEERLVHELCVQVAAADVEDDGHRRSDGRHIREILLRSDAEIDAPWPHAAKQVRDHVLEQHLV